MAVRGALPSLLFLAALQPGRAEAQGVAFRRPAIRLTPPAAASHFASLAPHSTPGAPDLFVGMPAAGLTPASGAFWPRATPLAPAPFPYTQLPLTRTSGRPCFAAGLWNNGDGLADLAWCSPGGVDFNLSPNGGLETILRGDVPDGLLFARLLDRPEAVLVTAETVALPAFDLYFVAGAWQPQAAVNLGFPAAIPGAPGAATWLLQSLRLGALARGVAVPGKVFDDVAWSRTRIPSLFVVFTSAAAAGLVPQNYPGAVVDFPTFERAQEVHGAGALDVDGDGIPDLVAALWNGSGTPGDLVAVSSDGTLAGLASGARTSMNASLGLSDPAFAGSLDLAGVPALAVWDQATAEVVVATRDAAGLATWKGPAAGAVRELLAGDLTGSQAPDLAVAYADGSIDVFAGALPPAVAWRPGDPPAHASRRSPLTLRVDAAADPGGSIARVDLLLFARDVPTDTSRVAPYTLSVGPAELAAAGCTLQLRARATDDLDIWREVAGSVTLDLDPPVVALPSPPLPLKLVPGGTRFALEGSAFDPCATSLTFQWSVSGLPAGSQVDPPLQRGPASQQEVFVPESAYAELVGRQDRTAQFDLMVVNGAGAASEPATAAVAFDASGLLALRQASDRTELAPGELALLTTMVTSQVGVDLPQVRLDTFLDGLVPAGEARVRGARLISQVDGGPGTVLTLDAVPGGGIPVVVELPVRRVLSRQGSTGAQALAAASGAALSPLVTAEAPRATRPGLSCGQAADASPLGLALLALYVNAMRRVPARTRSTSSSTPMRRQA